MKTATRFPAASLNTPRHQSIALGALLLFVVSLVFHSALHYSFAKYDDNILVYANPHYITAGASDGGLAYFWSHPHQQLYMPLTYTIWGVVASVARFAAPIVQPNGETFYFDPGPFHLVNLIFHLLNTLWVFAILRLLVRDALPAAAGALLFAVHPLQAECVVWVSELKGLLSGFFMLGSVWFYANFATRREAGDSFYRDGALSAMLFVLALLSKPSAVALPVGLLVLEIAWFGAPVRKAALSLAPFFVIATIGGLVARTAQPVVSEIPTVALWQRFFVAGDALAFYFGRFLCPISLAIDYGRRPDWLLQHSWGYATWIFPAISLALAWKFGNAALKTGMGFFIACLIPVLGFLPFVYQAHSTVADRYVYVALLGPCLALAGLLAGASTPHKRRTLYSGAACALVVLALLCKHQTSYWANDMDLFGHSVAVNARSATTQGAYADELSLRGEKEEALAHYQAAIALDGSDPTFFIDMGNVLMELDRANEAVSAFKAATILNPKSAPAHYNLANALSRSGNLPEAEKNYRICLRLDPRTLEAYNNLAITLARLNRPSEAIVFWQKSLELSPDNPEVHFNLANALMKENKPQDAIAHYMEVIRLAPDFPPARPALQRALNLARRAGTHH
jgi:tetratricopeptide (TPR) repeat protein